MDNPKKTVTHNNSMEDIIGNMFSMISGACMGSGIILNICHPGQLSSNQP